jgi:hypothetical protein
MPKLEGGKIWLTTAEVAEFGVSENYIWQGLFRHRKLNTPSWKHRKHPEDRRITQIDYDSIPDSTKSKLPAKQELIEQYKAQQSESLGDAADMITKAHGDCLRIEDGHYFRSRGSLGTDKAQDLMSAAAWLRLLAAYKTKKDALTLGVADKKQLREIVIQLILEQDMHRRRQLYGFKVSNVAVLQRKELRWSKSYRSSFAKATEDEDLPKIQAEQAANHAALDTLLHANTGNNNRRIVGVLNPDPSKQILIAGGRIDLSEWHASRLLYFYTNPGSGGKFDFEEIHWRYSKLCRENDKKPVSISEVKHFLNLKEVKQYTVRERDGYKQLDRQLPYVKREKASYSLLKGGFDGFSVDFRTRTDEGIVMLIVVAVFDYHSEAITGFSIGLPKEHERGRLVRDMYLNHLNLHGKSYIELESDRAAFNTSPETMAIFEKTCKYFTQPGPKDTFNRTSNPKARKVERLLQEVNRLVQKGDVKGWKGSNITSYDPKRKPNEDYPLDPVPTYEDAVKQIIDLVSVFNNQKLKKYEWRSRMEVFESAIHPDAIDIPVWEKALLLHQSTKTQVRNGNISITVNDRPFEYAYPEYIDHAHLMMKGYRVKVHFNEQDMNTVDVFGENDIYLATLSRFKKPNESKYILDNDPDQQKALGQQEYRRSVAEEQLTWKAMEMEASVYGEDLPRNVSKEMAYEILKGWRMQYRNGIVEPFDKRFSEELITIDAVTTSKYYEDALLRSNDMKVPVTTDKSTEEKRREFIRKNHKK